MADKTFSVTTETPNLGLTTSIRTTEHTWKSDEPVEVGGNNEGPSPYDILVSALGACTGMTINLYAKRKGYALTSVIVHLKHDKVYMEDCMECEKAGTQIDLIEREIELVGDLTAEEKQRLMVIAEKCPVHKTLSTGFKVRSTLRE